MLQKVKDTTISVLGQFYLVPCAKRIHINGDIDFIPIIGVEHNDPQLGFPMKHYHVDCRFIKKGPSFEITKDGTTSAAITTTSKFPYIQFVGIDLKRKKCVRLNTGLNLVGSGIIYEKFYRKYLGKSCMGKRCPHLGTTMHECDGVLRCPLHDLIGDLKTETIIPHP